MRDGHLETINMDMYRVRLYSQYNKPYNPIHTEEDWFQDNTKTLMDGLHSEMGFNEPEHTKWASTIVSVPKKGLELIFDVNYWKRNDLTTQDSYPIRRMY